MKPGRECCRSAESNLVDLPSTGTAPVIILEKIRELEVLARRQVRRVEELGAVRSAGYSLLQVPAKLGLSVVKELILSQRVIRRQ